MTVQDTNIPEGWVNLAFGEICIINPTEGLKKGINAKSIPMDCINPFTRKISRYEEKQFNGGMKFRNGDTLLARITPCLENGKTAFVDCLDDEEVGFGSTEYIVIREKHNLSDKKFLYYFVSSSIFREIAIKAMTGTSGRQRVQTDVLVNKTFLFPSFIQQKTIASILSSFDDKIELLREQNETLEEIAQTIFQEWFGKYNIKDELPEGWRIGSLMDIMDFEGGTQPASDKFEDLQTDENIRLVQIRDYDSDNNITYIPNIGNLRYCSERDIMIGRYGAAVGRVLFGLVGAYNVALVKVIPSKSIQTEFLRTYLKSFEFQHRLSGLTGRSAQEGFNKSDFRSFDIVIPNDIDFDKYEGLVSTFISKILYNKQQIIILSKARDELLPKLMNGEIRV